MKLNHVFSSGNKHLNFLGNIALVIFNKKYLYSELFMLGFHATGQFLLKKIISIFSRDVYNNY